MVSFGDSGSMMPISEGKVFCSESHWKRSSCSLLSLKNDHNENGKKRRTLKKAQIEEKISSHDHMRNALKRRNLKTTIKYGRKNCASLRIFLAVLVLQLSVFPAQGKKTIHFNELSTKSLLIESKNKYGDLVSIRGGARKVASAPRTTGSLRQKMSLKTRTKHMNLKEKKVDSKIAVRSRKKNEEKSTTEAADEHPKEDPRILFLIRLLFLTYYGSLGSLMPYLPVYYDSLGHGGQIIGLLGAVKPFTTFLVAPAWGIFADQLNQPFRILKVTFLVSLIGQLAVAVRHDAFFMMFMAFVTALFNAPVKSLIDTIVMDQLHDPSASYGRLRLWGQLGFGLGSSAVGVLLSKSHVNVEWSDVSTRPSVIKRTANLPPLIASTIHFLDQFWQTMTGYKLLFFTHGALSIPTWMCIKAFQTIDRNTKNLAVQSQQKQMEKSMNEQKHKRTVPEDKQQKSGKQPPQVLGGLKLLVHNADAMLFFFLVFVVGVSSGIIENFAYVRMREVGGTGKAMGLSRLVSSVAGAPMFWFSGPLTAALGADRVLVLSLLSYVTRFFIYAGMRNPYHGLPAEALRGVTFAAFWSTGTVYAHRVSPPGMHATMLIFLNAMYGGLGQSLGAIIGGKLQDKFGTVLTFVFSGLFDLCFVGIVVAYLLMNQEESSFKNPKPIEAPEPSTK